MSLLERSICGSILIIAIMLVRVCRFKRLPKRTFLVLWGLAIYRLLTPYAPFSKCSIYYSVYHIFNRWQEQSPEAFGQMQETIVQIQEGRYSEILTYIWIGGLAICAIVHLLSYFRCMREFHTSLPVEEDWVDDWTRWHRTRRDLSVRQSDRIKTPLTYGVIQPVILLPKGMLTADESKLKCVLEHEYVHIRTFDALLKLLLVVVLCMHWFNPLVWLMVVYCNRDIELACDELVIKELKEQERGEYARMLIALEAERSGYALSFVGYGKKTMEARIEYIVNYQKPGRGAIMAGILTVFAVALVFATVGDKSDSLYWRMRMVDEENTKEYYAEMSEGAGAFRLARDFWEAYVAGDMDGMRKLLPENYDGLLEGFPTEDSRFNAESAVYYGGTIPTRGMETGDTCEGRVKFRTGVEGEPDWDLWLEFRKTKEGWEIISFLGLKEQEKIR